MSAEAGFEKQKSWKDNSSEVSEASTNCIPFFIFNGEQDIHDKYARGIIIR